MNVKISVFISCYNQEKFIADAIESIIRQEVSYPYEIIICDDASTDGSKEIIEKYHSKYPDLIRVLFHEKNLGLVQNFFTFVDEALGEYLCFCEGDDYWIYPKKMQEQVDFLESNPDYSLVYSKVNALVESTKRIHMDYYNVESIKIKSGNILESISLRYFMHTSTLCTRAGIMREYKSYISKFLYLMSTWDYSFLIYANGKGKAKFMLNTYSVQRLYPESVTGTNDMERKYAIFVRSTFLQKFYIMKKLNFPDNLKTKIILDFAKKLMYYGIELENDKMINRSKKVYGNYLDLEKCNILFSGLLIDRGFSLDRINLVLEGYNLAKSNKIKLEYFRTIKIFLIKYRFLYHLFNKSIDLLRNISFIRKRLKY